MSAQWFLLAAIAALVAQSLRELLALVAGRSGPSLITKIADRLPETQRVSRREEWLTEFDWLVQRNAYISALTYLLGLWIAMARIRYELSPSAVHRMAALSTVWKSRRLAIMVATGCLIVAAGDFVMVVGLVHMRMLMQAPPTTTQRLAIALTIVRVLGGLISAAAAALAVTLAVRESRSSSKRRSDLLVPKLLPHDRLIGRSFEMGRLVELLGVSQVVGCYGPRGAGKSFLLEYLTDIVNGHRPRLANQPELEGMTAALYFDLADAVGFREAQAQICISALGNPAGAWEDFILFVQRHFGRRRILLILDNVNSEGLWRQLGEAAYRYGVVRPQDRVIFGSIERVVLSNLPVEHLEVPGFDLEAAAELVTTRGVSMSHDQLIQFHDDCHGLPIYLRLLATPDTRSWRPTHLDEELVPDDKVLLPDDKELVPEFPPNARQLLAYISVIALVDRRISINELRRCPIANLDKQLSVAENGTLISAVPTRREKRFKIHDLVRDTALRRLRPEVESAALFLFERALIHGQLERAALFAMFTDPRQIEATRLDEVLQHAIRDAIRTRNYALLVAIYERAAGNAAFLRFLAADEARGDLLCLARASELAGIGRYVEAEEELLSSGAVRVHWGRDAEATDLKADLRFLQADVAHLLNRYDEAARIFEELGGWAATHARPDLEACCLWGHGHVLRHQGRDLDKALELFERATDLATGPAELFVRAYSLCNAIGLRIFRADVPEDQEQQLRAIEDELTTDSTHHGYLLEVWKTLAQLAWLRGNRQQASGIVDAAIERALELNDRLLYNLYFERAEFRRLSGQPVAALEGYRAVLAFGEDNHDRNLVTNALLGIVLCEIASGRWLHHQTAHAARNSVLRAYQEACEADIQVTARIAEQIIAMLDGAGSPDGIRLFLL